MEKNTKSMISPRLAYGILGALIEFVLTGLIIWIFCWITKINFREELGRCALIFWIMDSAKVYYYHYYPLRDQEKE